MGEVVAVETLREAIPLLRRPFTAEAVKFKPQSVLGEGKGVLVVAYIDVRLVIERLNLLVPYWKDAYRPIGDGMMWCDLTVDDVTHSDVGEGKGKALVSDSLKRAAVKFGVGVSLYAIPQQTLWANTHGNLIKIWKAGSKPNGKDKYDARLEDGAMPFLRAEYTKWLKAQGIPSFGEPLDHGDAADSQGDLEAAAQDQAAEAPDAPSTAPEQVHPTPGTVEALDFMYQAIVARDKKVMTKAQYERMLADAHRSENGFKDAGKILSETLASVGGDVDAVRAEYKRLRVAA